MSEKLESTICFKENVFDIVPIGIVVVNKSFEIVELNAGFCSIFGYEYKELLGQQLNMLLPLDFRAEHKKKMRQYAKNPTIRKMSSEIPFVSERKNKETIYCEIGLSPTERQGETYYIAVVKDVTDTHFYKKQIESYAKFPKEDPNIVVRVSKEGKLLYANKPIREIYSELLLKDRMHLIRRVKNIILNIRNSGNRSELEFKIGVYNYFAFFVPIQGENYINIYAFEVTNYGESIKAKQDLLQKLTKLMKARIAEQLKELEEYAETQREQKEEIIKSVNYAKLIQNSLLDHYESCMFNTLDYFYFYRPKDIVSGDFYWSYCNGGRYKYYAVGDCTGHGIPGAFLSVLSMKFLDEIFHENNDLPCNEILERLRTKVISIFHGKNKIKLNDGLDISLIRIDICTSTMQYSAANNDIIFIRGNDLSSLKATKSSVSFEHGLEKPFEMAEISLFDGDCIYMFSDGYYDQFGGAKGKKMKKRLFLDLLMEISGEATDNQKIRLIDFFDNWKGDVDQIDDVTVMGILYSSLNHGD